MRRAVALVFVLLAVGCAGEREDASERPRQPGGTAPAETDAARTDTQGGDAETETQPARSGADGDAPTPEPTPPRQPPAPPAPTTPPAEPDPGLLAQTRLFVGFHDDPSFRWRRDRGVMLRRARDAGATVIRTTVDWSEVAPEPPRRDGDPFDPSLRLDGIDELVRRAQSLGVEVLLTIWGTPAWANAAEGRNRPPHDHGDLEAFARALADRYSGRHAGYPFVRFYSVWNEPNLEQFLAPQFDAQGRSVSPWLYHRIFRAAYAGLKAGSPRALVGAGETSPRGRDTPSPDDVQDSHSPAGFAGRLSRLRPRLRFDAWAHHPYPRGPRSRPLAPTPWPNVRLENLRRFEAGLDSWFGRRSIPIWLTEYAHETRPHDAKGVDAETQARFARDALEAAARDPRVRMFVWFTFRDDAGNPWQSGVVEARSRAKPALASFGAVARTLDARVAIRHAGGAEAVVRMGALELAYHVGAGAAVGVTARLRGPNGEVVRRPRVRLARDGWLTFRLPVDPTPGARYVLEVAADDVYGHRVARRALVRGVD